MVLNTVYEYELNNKRVEITEEMREAYSRLSKTLKEELHEHALKYPNYEIIDRINSIVGYKLIDITPEDVENNKKLEKSRIRKFRKRLVIREKRTKRRKL